ncbi:zinc finger CCCH domain-containing protein 11A isoform X4 [Hydra vulgaris]|uniref:Zinc finger CCCH domain-containing protein 11A isoform X4 n=1 Tax=Hydra vulgaris TaxID=6087 RepID=A0ABM4C8L1_HYDVU
MALVGDDCYFYYTSGCVRGMQCAFRHQPAAKNTEIVCPDWLGGACFKQTCLLRHMLMPNARVQIQCRWDTMPSGCLDSGCTYAHINKNVIIPGPSPIEVKSSTSSNVRQPLLSSPLARTSVLKFSNEIPSLQSNNSISQIVNVMPQANIVEALPGPILNPPGVINVAPPIIPLQQPLILNVPRPHLHSSILDFQQQVQLFKDLLAQKNKTYDSEELENGKRDKYKEKIRHKKEKKNVRKFSKDSKKKIKLSKVDEEILFGDYKDIPLEKKKKKEQSDSIQNINIKSYEEILREKVFRKTMEKRREFAEDFKDLTSDERNKNKFEKQNNKKRTKAVPNVSMNDNDSISKDDVIEVGIDGSPIREDLPNGNHARSPKKESKKTAPESSHDESVEIYIPDETADINISIDENDELVKELNEASHQKHSVARSKITNVMHKNSGDKVASVSKKNKSLMTDVVNKRKVIRLDKDDKSPVLNNKEDTLKSDIKIKTFEEIMQEKRKRKNMSSEPEMNTVKKILDPLHIKSVKAKTELRRSVVGTRENKDKDSKKETNDVFKVRSTLGLTSISKKNVETNLKDSNVGTVAKKIITIAKPVINGKNSEDNSIGIRSFDEIMREKQLRKQNESRNKSLGGNQVNQVSNEVKFTEKVNLDQTSKPTEKATLRQKSKPTEKINSMPTSKSSDNVGSVSTSKSPENVGSSSTYKSSEKLGSMPTTKHDDKIVVISASKPTEKVTSMLTSKPTEKVSPMLNSKPVEKVASMSISKPSEKVTSVNHLHKQSTLSENDKEIHVKSNISSQIKNLTEKNSSTLEHIKEALDEVKRKRDEYLLSDEEFEKEINDLSSNEGEGCINDDLDDDDLIIELSEMIDGN